MEGLEIVTLIYDLFSFFGFLLTVFGTIVITVSVAKFHYLQNTTNIFIVNLAVADLFIGMFKMYI